MRGVTIWLTAALVVGGGAACSNSTAPPADPITGAWSGKFDNGIPITAALTLTGSSIAGTYKASADSGTVTGTYAAGTLDSLQFKALAGTQRTLSNARLLNNGTEVEAHWDDGAGLSGTVCLAKPGPVTSCP